MTMWLYVGCGASVVANDDGVDVVCVPGGHVDDVNLKSATVSRLG